MSESKSSESDGQINSGMPRFAAVRFFAEENNKIHYVSVRDIRDFSPNDLSEAKYVKSNKETSSCEPMYEPAQILEVSGNFSLNIFYLLLNKS